MSGTNNAVNAPFPLSPTQGGLGVVSPTAHGILIGEGSSPVASLVLGAGELPIGTTSGDAASAALIAGAGIGISSVSGSITISATGPGSFAWNNVASSTQTLAVNSGYITNNGGSLVTYTLPTISPQGTEILISGFSSGGWTIAQNASQLIHVGNQTTTTGVTGTLSSTNAFDQVRLLCVVANTTWVSFSSFGNLAWA